MKRRDALLLLATLPATLAAQSTPVGVHVFKNADCGCCGEWVKHLEKAGFRVKVTNVTDTTPVRARVGMPERYGSCHTATVEGYVLEGHVPASDVRRLIETRPAAVGLAVPGMPVGSPGMEVGDRVDRYDVLLVQRTGDAKVFARYPDR
jgi:hypothetical protein